MPSPPAPVLRRSLAGSLRRRQAPRLRVAAWCAVAAVVTGGVAPPLLSAFVGALPRAPVRPGRQPLVGAAATEQDVDDKLEAVLRKKRVGQRKESDDDISDWARRAAQKVTDQLPEEKEKKARQEAARAEIDRELEREAGDSAEIVAQSRKKRRRDQLVKKSLDEVLKRSYEDDERPGNLPAKRDVYNDVGITATEVDAYWSRRDESSQGFIDKFLGPAYIVLIVVVGLQIWSIYDSNVNPQEYTVSSMVGRD
ncbi:unnamed protein product [Prorocentrum cordatum]|uniref:Rhomboid-like protein n=1 Tax=Prorocentrum cordatum TaxID=2364126 RepID=A0ABN9QKN3_9DINO|nr:unnamed protein product [Polarella glacialis]